MSFDLKISNRDLVIVNGDFQKISGTEKLIQDILKIVMTPMGGNPFFTYYGSLINGSMIGSALDFQFSSGIASDQLRSALETLQNLQRAQMASSQKVTADELLAAVQSVEVLRNPVDPRYFSIFITVLTKALTQATATLDVQGI